MSTHYTNCPVQYDEEYEKEMTDEPSVGNYAISTFLWFTVDYLV
jgi:hypothetical protein